LVAVLAAAVPASASAANFYVDQEAGDDTNSCMGDGLAACEHIQAAVNKAAAGDTVHVADPSSPTIFTEKINDGNGVSIVSDSPDVAENTIDGANLGASAISVGGSTVGQPVRISGFTIQGQNFASVDAGSPVVIDHNRFNEPGPVMGGTSSELTLEMGTDGSKITHNVFVDSDPSVGTPQTGIAIYATGSVEISDNSLGGFSQGLSVNGGPGSTAVIDHNSITGTRPVSQYGGGVFIYSGHPTISRNRISAPVFNQPNDSLIGIVISLPDTANATGLTSRGNTIDGLTSGLLLENVRGEVTLEGDVISNTTTSAIRLYDDGADDPGVSDMTATNVDIIRSHAPEPEIALGATHLTLDSSVIGAGGIDATQGGTCTITHSRGPVASANGCETFQTTADPMFVNPATGDFHLQSGSSLIDAGNPAAPDSAAIDMDGEAFGLTSSCPLGTGVRDIGADEVKPVGCAPAVDPIDQTPPDETPPQGDAPDKTAPETTLTQAPKGKLRHRKATFAFVATEAGATFMCSLDGAAPSPCASPLKLKHLKRGKHQFDVAAVDAAGNADLTPASANFKVSKKGSR
jgi:hypothetical protein